MIRILFFTLTAGGDLYHIIGGAGLVLKVHKRGHKDPDYLLNFHLQTISV